jgi:hypothetical protein
MKVLISKTYKLTQYGPNRWAIIDQDDNELNMATMTRFINAGHSPSLTPHIWNDQIFDFMMAEIIDGMGG